MLKVPILKHLFKQLDDGIWCELTSFVKILKDNQSKDDKIKVIKTANLVRDLKPSSKTRDGQTFVTLTGIIRFCYNHHESLKICQQIVNQINDVLVSGKVTVSEPNTKTCLELYNLISKSALKNTPVEKILLENLTIEEENISYIYTEYKSFYSELEWKKICLFEIHFEREHCLEKTYEDLVQEKWNFWNVLESSLSVASHIFAQSKNAIAIRNDRKEAASDENTVKIWVSDVSHSAKKIDQDAFQQCVDFNIDNILNDLVSFDCIQQCSHNKGIHIIVELLSDLKDNELGVLEDLAVVLRRSARKQHDLHCPSIAFLKPASLAHYESCHGINRFLLRDDYFQGKISENVVFTSIELNDDGHNDDNKTCESCSINVSLKPLHWNTFSLLQEWQLDVPLMMQYILECFINKNTVKKTKDMNALLQQKLTGLYSVYDTLLNLYNRTHIGIIQQRNTDELIMNYRSIQTVFDITSETGTTLSLKEAERQLQEKADPELCYYNTYLRKYVYQDESTNEITTENLDYDFIVIQIQGKIGHSNYSVCTLPVTIKGLPKDAKEVKKWHDPNICDGTLHCFCLKRKQVNKTDGTKCLTEISEQEKTILQRFYQLIQWSLVESWAAIKIEPRIQDLLPLLKGEKMPDCQDVDREDKQIISDLETSLMSLELNETDQLPELDMSFQSLNIESDEDIHDISHSSDIYTVEYAEVVSPKESNVDPVIYDSDTMEEQLPEEDFDLHELLDIEDCLEPESSTFILETDKRDLNDLRSVCHDVGNETQNSENNENCHPILASVFKFKAYKAPSLLCRHPPPYTGRDDDEAKLREILDDILTKTDNCRPYADGQVRMLFAPDHKIGKNLINLMSRIPKYQIVLPEFPILHLRKSRICNIFSGYKNAGLIHILKYMRDDHSDEWSKLLSERCIDDATNVILRISLSINLALLIRFMQDIPAEQAIKLIKDLDDKNYDAILSTWDFSLQEFVEKSAKSNATFALHREMMIHCNEVLAIAFSERLGGTEGYQLLLGAVKSSLPFAYLNGATSYASYTTQLLHEHYSAGIFHQNMKMSLYSTPHKFSQVNFGLDSQREMDHRDVVKGFRSGSSLKSIIPRMSVIDELMEAHDRRQKMESHEQSFLPFCTISKTDLKHLIPTAELIIRRNGLQTDTNIIPYNVYAKKNTMLSTAILDTVTFDIGRYLMKKYIATEGLFGNTNADLPPSDQIIGPKPLVDRVKKTKGTVINRTKFKQAYIDKTEKEIAEEKRVKKVTRIQKNLDHLSSTMNACQALVKPDCSKPKVMKATGVQVALTSLLAKLIESSDPVSWENFTLDTIKEADAEKLSNAHLVWLKNKSNVPVQVAEKVTLATVEFAGVKFKCKVPTGSQYLDFVQKSVLRPILSTLPNATRIVICEEKYSYTPDDFKAATREQRKKTSNASIAHLKTGEDIINENTFIKEAIVSTQEGKTQISTYLAKNAHTLNIHRNITLDFDSELCIEGCNCEEASRNCSCKTYSVPLRCKFSREKGFVSSEFLHYIHQTKGEAEMSQVDWLIGSKDEFQDGQAVMSIVTSGDIDAILIHMFSISYLWPRKDDNTFRVPVYVMLQKPGKIFDLYCITNILELLEKKLVDLRAGIKVSLALCFGGNDFIPKYYGMSHKKIMEVYLKTDALRLGLFNITADCIPKITINKDLYKDLVKRLYSPKKFNPDNLSLEEVRSLTMKVTRSKQSDPVKPSTRNPQLWMPPSSTLERVILLLECQIKYLLIVGLPNAELPNFLQNGCLRKTESGDVEYDFGPDSYLRDVDQIHVVQLGNSTSVRGKNQRKRKQDSTPQKGSRRKLPMSSTPSKKK